MLVNLTVEASLNSPSLVRLLSDVCKLSPGQALRRLEGSKGNAAVRDAFPELASVRLAVPATTSPCGRVAP